jgi:Flp pilus assembly protein TadG
MLCNVLRFLKDRGGNIAPIFALSLVPTVGMIGAAVDYTRANEVKTAMQSALDATTLAMAQSAGSLDASTLSSNASNYFKALFTKPGTTGVQLTVNYSTTSGPQLAMTAATSVRTQFMNIPGIGIQYIGVSAASTTQWGNSRLRVALALDNTGSMAQSSKLTTLKTAAKNLIDQLSSAATTPDDVYVSIIPFAKDVNIGKGNVSATWVRWSDPTSADTDLWDDQVANGGSCSKSGANNRSQCQAQGTCSVNSGSNNTAAKCSSAGTCSISNYTSQNNCTSHGVCSKSQYTSQSQCSSNRGTWTVGAWTPATWTAATWTPPASHTAWQGCVMDRDQSFDVDNTAPVAGTPTTLFPAEQYSACPVEIMPLSNNWTNLKTKIDSMAANGNTNTTIGLEWAWHSLSQGAPLSAPAQDSNYTYKNVIIFLTDGDNTQNRFTSTVSNIDARMTAACTNAKNAGIEIYTILVIQGTASLLQGCASNTPGTTDHYYNVTASSQLVSVFNQIGTKLAKLHVAK